MLFIYLPCSFKVEYFISCYIFDIPSCLSSWYPSSGKLSSFLSSIML
uniref:Macaca fascicularis brain cDNA clone: QflA-20424, similar to human solute carrier family 30 (zinc transporter), member 5(SLC30A5), mRNA, RefSeq: NM_022902.2 n=1 Tax=Macaca fascicularis TaxID=9541 RepID=I7GNC7_MACFA|nr:unnamed protein product [Macaca fascicularis]